MREKFRVVPAMTLIKQVQLFYSVI